MFRWLKLISSGKGLRKRVENDPDYLEFLRTADEFEPKDGIDYEWVKEHSKWEFDHLSKFIGSLDSKADWLVKFYGSGTGLLALVFAYLLKNGPPSWLLIGHLGPVLFLLVIALCLAVRVRSPDMLPDLPNTHKAVTFAEHYSEADFAMMRGVACQGLRIALEYKGRMLRIAYWLLIASMVWISGFALFSALFL